MTEDSLIYLGIRRPSINMNTLRFTQKFKTALPLITALLCLSSLTAFSQAGEPSRDPILRIETGMHIAPIYNIGVDRAGRFLVTASPDKTVRVWEIETGRLLRVLRVPIDRVEAASSATSISPDGKLILVGGQLSDDREQFCVYVFDLESGQLIHRLTGLPGGASRFRFSPDGTMVAATLGKGVRVWRTSDWADVGRDTYGDDLNCYADLDRRQRLVSSCTDGELRLYDRDMHLLVRGKASGGKFPGGVRFSPDGSKVAIFYFEGGKVEVLSGETLAPLYTANTSNHGSTCVSWSTDGTKLFAGAFDRAQAYIRRWSDAGRGDFVDTPVGSGPGIWGIEPLPSGGIAYGSSYPSWGLLDSSNQQTRVQIGQIAKYEGSKSSLLISSSASTVGFDYEYGGRSPAVFQLGDRTLARDPMPEGFLLPPRAEAPGISVSGLGTYSARLNSIPLKLNQYEMSRSVALAPNAGAFLLGTFQFIHLFDRSGQELWKVSAPGDAWRVNISGDGHFAVAAYGDGTIRWYRISDGKELLAFFPHADRKRWVLWTPSGYYDASPGAEDLIGWHVNNGKDQAADFFPVGQFRSTYYRPDVISKILETGDEARALQLANEERGRKTQSTTVAQMLPPVVEITSPSDNSLVSSSEVTIRYSLRTASGEPVTKVRALIDGRPVTDNRQLTQETASASGVRELKVSVPDHDSEVSIIAENKFAASVPATIRLKWRGSVPASDAFVIQPKLYVLAIGVSQYQNPAYSLKFAAKDAQDFANAAMIQKGLLYRDVVTKILTNEHANKDEILDGLDWIRKQTTSKDVAMVFFAGHGMNDQNGVYYFLPYNTDLEKILRTGVPYTDIKNTVQSLAGKTLFFIDTCHSGNVLGGRRGLADDLNGVINELASAESGAVVFAASTGNQSSFEDAKWNNGAFTKALVEGLMGRADYTGKGKITINMLDLYLSERVKELTGGKQTPTTAKPSTIQDFPIAVKR